MLNSAKKQKKGWRWAGEVRMPWLISLFPGDSFVLVIRVEKNGFTFKVRSKDDGLRVKVELLIEANLLRSRSRNKSVVD